MPQEVFYTLHFTELTSDGSVLATPHWGCLTPNCGSKQITMVCYSWPFPPTHTWCVENVQWRGSEREESTSHMSWEEKFERNLAGQVFTHAHEEDDNGHTRSSCDQTLTCRRGHGDSSWTQCNRRCWCCGSAPWVRLLRYHAAADAVRRFCLWPCRSESTQAEFPAAIFANMNTFRLCAALYITTVARIASHAQTMLQWEVFEQMPSPQWQ